MKVVECCLHVAFDSIRVRIDALCLIWERKEAFRARKMSLDVSWSETMVGDDEESDLFGSSNELLLDFVLTRLKVYSRNITIVTSGQPFLLEMQSL